MNAKVWCRRCASFYGDIELEGRMTLRLLCSRCNERGDAIISETRPVVAKAIAHMYNSN